MSYTRFLQLKKFFIYINSDHENCDDTTDPWWKADGMIDRFNENRVSAFSMSSDMNVDESMSAFRPQTTAYGNLPTLSYIQRKPEDLGTELKVVVDALLGVMAFIEIQKGRVTMADAEFVLDLGHKTAACSKRLMVGTSAHARQVLDDSYPDVDSVVDPTPPESLLR